MVKNFSEFIVTCVAKRQSFSVVDVLMSVIANPNIKKLIGHHIDPNASVSQIKLKIITKKNTESEAKFFSLSLKADTMKLHRLRIDCCKNKKSFAKLHQVFPMNFNTGPQWFF